MGLNTSIFSSWQTRPIYFSLTWPHKVLEVTKIAKLTTPEEQPISVMVKTNE